MLSVGHKKPQSLAVHDDVLVYLIHSLVLELELFPEERRTSRRGCEVQANDRSFISATVQFSGQNSQPILLQIICVDVVLRILVCQETGDLDDGRVEAAAVVPPRGRRLLSEEYLGAAEVVDVNQRHTAGGRLDGFHHAERCLVA